MTRSIFDPTGGETEQSGSRNLGPDAGNNSHMPPGVVDGDVSDQEIADHDQALADLAAAAKAADPDRAADAAQPKPGVWAGEEFDEQELE